MAQFLPDEDKLVRFLRENRPLPPTGSLDLEKHILERIKQKVSPSPVHPPWMVPAGLLACALALGWGIGRIWQPQPQIAATPAEIEAFLLESWQSSLNYPANSWEEPLLTPDDTHP